MEAWRKRWKAWFNAKRPVWRFVGLFCLSVGTFYALCALPVVRSAIFPAYLRANAQVTAFLLGAFEEGVVAHDQMISSSRAQIRVERGCDAVEPAILLASAVLAFPARPRRKLSGILFGTLVLAGVNVIRLGSLYVVSARYESLFDFVHIDVWQPAFVVLVGVIWASWALRGESRRERAVRQ